MNCCDEVPSIQASDRLIVSMDQVENGYIVSCRYPQRMIPNASLDTFQTLLGRLSSIASAKEGDPEAVVRGIHATINKCKRPSKPIRQQNEVHVFQDLKGALKFVQEVFETSGAEAPVKEE